MWADHVEFPKSALRRTITHLESLTADNEALRKERDEALARLNAVRADKKNILGAAVAEERLKTRAESRADALAKALRKSRRILGNSELHETTRVVDAIDAIDAALGDRP
jgi:hypothetical protein